MATLLRDLSYCYPALYDAISWTMALWVGGEARFRQLALNGLAIAPDTQVLDLCCGSGQATRFLVRRSRRVTGLDASPRSLDRARRWVPAATYVQAMAEHMPFAEGQFDLVHTSMALHEMQPLQLRQILQEVYRVLKPGGCFTVVDFHRPHNPVLFPGLALFFALFETETAWTLLDTDLAQALAALGFGGSPQGAEETPIRPQLYLAGTLQVIQAYRPNVNKSECEQV